VGALLRAHKDDRDVAAVQAATRAERERYEQLGERGHDAALAAHRGIVALCDDLVGANPGFKRRCAGGASGPAAGGAAAPGAAGANGAGGRGATAAGPDSAADEPVAGPVPATKHVVLQLAVADLEALHSVAASAKDHLKKVGLKTASLNAIKGRVKMVQQLSEALNGYTAIEQQLYPESAMADFGEAQLQADAPFLEQLRAEGSYAARRSNAERFLVETAIGLAGRSAAAHERLMGGLGLPVDAGDQLAKALSANAAIKAELARVASRKCHRDRVIVKYPRLTAELEVEIDYGDNDPGDQARSFERGVSYDPTSPDLSSEDADDAAQSGEQQSRLAAAAGQSAGGASGAGASGAGGPGAGGASGSGAGGAGGSRAGGAGGAGAGGDSRQRGHGRRLPLPPRCGSFSPQQRARIRSRPQPGLRA
jgi:hypothetical protein